MTGYHAATPPFLEHATAAGIAQHESAAHAKSPVYAPSPGRYFACAQDDASLSHALAMLAYRRFLRRHISEGEVAAAFISHHHAFFSLGRRSECERMPSRLRRPAPLISSIRRRESDDAAA